MVNGICSSGSTGLPKVILNIAPALWTPQHSEPFLAQWTPVVGPQTILVPAPMYHTNGFATLNCTCLAGDRLVVLERFNAALVLDLVERHRVTNFTATPTMLARIAAAAGVGRRDLSSVEWILQGAAVMPAALLHKWFELLSPEQIVMAYGMTENLGITALRGDEWLAHPGSVGRGFRDTEIRILDGDGAPVPVGELGEIYLRAPMSAGYRYLGGAPPLPSRPDGFSSAGDIGYLDSHGYLYIADRRTDMIVSGGANVYPAEVESALAEHPDIADVVVIGLADPQWGRRVHAVIQPADPANPLTEPQVIEYAKSRLAHIRCPRPSNSSTKSPNGGHEGEPLGDDRGAGRMKLHLKFLNACAACIICSKPSGADPTAGAICNTPTALSRGRPPADTRTPPDRAVGCCYPACTCPPANYPLPQLRTIGQPARHQTPPLPNPTRPRPPHQCRTRTERRPRRRTQPAAMIGEPEADPSVPPFIHASACGRNLPAPG